MKILFDSLAYADKLKDGGVDKAEVHSSALHSALADNFYIKDEVDNMFELTMQRIENKFSDCASKEQLNETNQKLNNCAEKNQLNETNRKLSDIRTEMHEVISKQFHKTVVVLGSLIIIVGFLTTTAHYYLH